MPRPKRRAIRAFYAFCRTTDDIVDVPRAALTDLADWRSASHKPSDTQTNPVLLAWSHTAEQFGVPRQYVEELIDGCALDLHVNRYETFNQLRRYCYLVASTVGLISMHLIGLDCTANKNLAVQSAIDLGVALQLTNILRDVGEDLMRGRIYLPQEDLRRFGLHDADLINRVNDQRFKALMRFEIERAYSLYESSMPAIAALNADGRLAVSAASLLYRGILGKIKDNDYDVYHRRAYLGTADKLVRLPAIYRATRRLTPNV